MKKFLIASFLGFTSLFFAQQNLVTQYPEELYQYNDNAALNGTARYRALSGAMGALGGDLSATMNNPASSAVFLKSEVAITAGVNTAKTDLNSNAGFDFDETEFNLQQAGGVFVFDDLQSNDWKNISIGLNYQKKSTVNEIVDLQTNNTAPNGDQMVRHYAERYGNSSVTNINVAANYQHKVYIGGGVNFHSSDAYTYESMRVNEPTFDDEFRYIKGATPNSRVSEGVSVNLGVIGKLNQQIRLAAAYQSPIWYMDAEEVVTNYNLYLATDDLGEYYYIDREGLAYLNDLTTAQKFTGSVAFVLGKNGLISADYTYTDYSPAKYEPERSFASENQYISNQMNGSSTFRIGGELRLQDFRLRGGFRHEQSPFEEMNIQFYDNAPAESYQPFGDLTGFSLGVGYEFKGFYLDAAYDMFKRDRNYIVSGNYYDYLGEVGADGITDDEAWDFLSLNAESIGYAQVVKDITEKQGNISLTVGFRF